MTTFDTVGFAVLRGALPGSLCRAVVDAWDRAWARDVSTNMEPVWASTMTGGTRRPTGGDPLAVLDPDPLLRLLGTPTVLGPVRAIVGPDALPAVVWALQKHAGDGAEVDWHQDTVHDRRYRVVTAGFHFDALTGRDRVHLVPGTERARQDMDAIGDGLDWNSPRIVAPELVAGDVLLHDAMMVHGSPARVEPGSRLTLYVEFRSAAHVLATEPAMEHWVEGRCRLLDIAERVQCEERAPTADERAEVTAIVAVRRSPGMRNQGFRPRAGAQPGLPRSA